MGVNEKGEYILKELPKAQKPWRRKYILLVKVVLIILVFFVGFVIGYFAMVGHSENKPEETHTSKSRDAIHDFAKYHEQLLKSLSAKNIESFSRYFTMRPHIGGSKESEKQADYILSKWKSYGFDTVEKVRYDVLLSLPRKGNPNSVKLLSPSGKVLVNVQGIEKFAEPSENDSLVTSPYLAYSPPGNVTGTLIYVNYGTREDFKKLASMGENCTGKIAIMRYGKLFRGDKINHAMDCGAIGVLLYCDPAECAADGMNNTYPDSWWLPSTAVQRGAVMNVYGDPLTRGLPAIPEVFRIDMNKTVGIPSIPAQAIGYGDAMKFLSQMKGRIAPPDWQGGLPITYRLGPGLSKPGMKVRLEVNNEYVTKPIYNVIGSIVGQEEPDRMVLIGSHRDAWAFGGIDPDSAVAVKMEISRALGELLNNTKWRPRRSIVFCSWGAEEFGLVGSTEWVEDNTKLLQDRAVAYFNLDSSVRGNYSYKAQGSPLLTDLTYNSSQLVPDPTESNSSLYDVWKAKYPSSSNKPRFGSLGSASDYAAFYQFSGVPCVDGRYEFQSMNVTKQPLYHTVHDTFYLMKHFNDPNFEIHLAMARLAARMLLSTADQPVLPFSVRYYAIALKRSLKLLFKYYKAQFDTKNITLSYLQSAVQKFQITADNFEKRKDGINEKTDFAKRRIFNDQLMQLERVFIYPYGLPGRPHIRHLIFAPMTNNAYGSSIFPGITDVLYDIRETDNWDEVKRQVSIVTHSILAASRLLAPIGKI